MTVYALPEIVRLMQLLAALACLVTAFELRSLLRSRIIESVWTEGALEPWWGWRRTLMTPVLIRWLPALQLTFAAMLLGAATLPARANVIGACASLGLLGILWLTAVRVRGTVNGGSDGMLFTVLLGLTIASWPGASPRVAAGGVLYVAAQLLLSYLRAGAVKFRQGEWWNGVALGAFIAIPAYGVPAWVPRSSAVLRVAGCSIVLFELAAPVALLNERSCLIYIAVAWCFHLATAVVFGLNRFLLAWTAALPSLLFAAHRLG